MGHLFPVYLRLHCATTQPLCTVRRPPAGWVFAAWWHGHFPHEHDRLSKIWWQEKNDEIYSCIVVWNTLKCILLQRAWRSKKVDDKGPEPRPAAAAHSKDEFYQVLSFEFPCAWELRLHKIYIGKLQVCTTLGGGIPLHVLPGCVMKQHFPWNKIWRPAFFAPSLPNSPKKLNSVQISLHGFLCVATQ